jgi:hypothetical protein
VSYVNQYNVATPFFFCPGINGESFRRVARIISQYFTEFSLWIFTQKWELCVYRTFAGDGNILWDLGFSHQRCRRFKSVWMWQCVVRCVMPNILEECSASVFRVAQSKHGKAPHNWISTNILLNKMFLFWCCYTAVNSKQKCVLMQSSISCCESFKSFANTVDLFSIEKSGNSCIKSGWQAVWRHRLCLALIYITELIFWSGLVRSTLWTNSVRHTVRAFLDVCCKVKYVETLPACLSVCHQCQWSNHLSYFHRILYSTSLRSVREHTWVLWICNFTWSASGAPCVILYAVNVVKILASDMDRIYHAIGRQCSTYRRDSKCILYETLVGDSKGMRLRCQGEENI